MKKFHENLKEFIKFEEISWNFKILAQILQISRKFNEFEKKQNYKNLKEFIKFEESSWNFKILA